MASRKITEISGYSYDRQTFAFRTDIPLHKETSDYLNALSSSKRDFVIYLVHNYLIQNNIQSPEELVARLKGKQLAYEIANPKIEVESPKEQVTVSVNATESSSKAFSDVQIEQIKALISECVKSTLPTNERKSKPTVTAKPKTETSEAKSEVTKEPQKEAVKDVFEEEDNIISVDEDTDSEISDAESEVLGKFMEAFG